MITVQERLLGFKYLYPPPQKILHHFLPVSNHLQIFIMHVARNYHRHIYLLYVYNNRALYHFVIAFLCWGLEKMVECLKLNNVQHSNIQLISNIHMLHLEMIIQHVDKTSINTVSKNILAPNKVKYSLTDPPKIWSAFIP